MGKTGKSDKSDRIITEITISRFQEIPTPITSFPCLRQVFNYSKQFKLMKIFKVTSLVASVALFLPISLASCTNYDTRAKNDAATGALMGAAAGAIIGGDTEDAVLGAAIGGAAGYGVGKARE